MYETEIEGSALVVCEKCAKFGKIIKDVKELGVEPRNEKNSAAFGEEGPKNEVIFILTDNFAEKIKKRREAIGIKQEDFAKMVNEKVSLIHHIETGRFSPGIDLARKLEKALKIKLVEQHEETHEHAPAASRDEFTIGDFIKINKK